MFLHSKGRLRFLNHPHVIGQLEIPLPRMCTLSRFPQHQSLDNHTINKMCFDDRDNYTTRVRVRNGVRYEEEYYEPGFGMSWRRRHGLGGSYYPSRYYARAPSGRYKGGTLVPSNRFSNYGGYPRHHNYPAGYSHYSNMGNYPQGVVMGGYSGYGTGGYGYDQAGYPRGVVTGGYAGYSSGYGRYHTGARIAVPRYSAMVSLCAFPLSPISLLSHLPALHRTAPLPLARMPSH